MNVPDLIAALQPFTDMAGGEARTPVAETGRRRYWIVGVHADADGDPVIEVVFNGGADPVDD